MAEINKSSTSPKSCEAYFDMVQRRKKLPQSLQESLTEAFAKIPVSSFPEVPGGKVIEIPADTLVRDAVQILSESNILSAPVINPEAGDSTDCNVRYLGIIDYSAIVLWVLESAELVAAAYSATSAAAAGVGAGTAGTLGTLAVGATGPVAIAGLAVAAVGAAVAGGVAAEKSAGKNAITVADKLGEDFYRVLLEEEPFKSATVKSLLKSNRWMPFIPVESDSPMLSVLLLLSKYRLRNVPIVETGRPSIKNFITQSAVVQGLERCKGRDWFDSISAHPISELGLPFMSTNEVICAQAEELILQAFKRMKDHEIGGVPVVEGPDKKIVGNLSIRDIRFLLLKPGLYSNIRHLTVKDFLITVASATNDMEKMIVPITCKLDSTLGSVIQTLASKSVHRIHVVSGSEDNNEVIGVITLRDVISCFIYEPPNFLDNYLGFSAQEIFKQ